MTKPRVAILISGRGSNMMALAEAARAADYPTVIACVIANRPGAGGLDYARSHDIPAVLIDHTRFASRALFEAALQQALVEHAVDIVALAGFMRVLSPEFVGRWQGRIVNIHPSLLPAYKGLHTHERALADGATRHGCSVHLVTAGLDDGPVLEQAEVPVLPGDSPEQLAARVLVEEHRIYPKALAALAKQVAAAG